MGGRQLRPIFLLLAFIAVLVVTRAGGFCFFSCPTLAEGASLAGLGVGGGSGLYGLVAIAVAIYLLRGSGGAGWGSYYLVWLVVPTLIAVFSANPILLAVVAVGIIGRRWLPDPYLYFKYAARIRSLETDVRANAANLTARRDLAVIWLAKHRPRRALPLLEQALLREPESTELRYLQGLSYLALRDWDKALEAFLAVLDKEPRFRYGDAYLRAADALLALGRWQDAEDGLEQFVTINRSSVEAHVKLAAARRHTEGADKARQRAALDEARNVYRDLPRFQRRRQLGWYLRATVRKVIG